MFGAPTFVPEVGRGYMDTPVTTYYYHLGEFAGPPNWWFIHATTRRVAGMSAYRADLPIVNRKPDVDHEKRLNESANLT